MSIVRVCVCSIIENCYRKVKTRCRSEQVKKKIDIN